MASIGNVKKAILNELRAFPANRYSGTAVVLTSVNVPAGSTAIAVYSGNYAVGSAVLRNDSATTIFVGAASTMVAAAPSVPINPAAQLVLAAVDLSKLFCLEATAGESGATLTILFSGCTC